MKVAAVIKAICWALLALILSGILFGVLAVRTAFNIWDWTWDNFWNYSDYDSEAYKNYNLLGDDYQSQTKKLTADEISSVEIDWGSGDIVLEYLESNDGEISVTENANKTLNEKTAMRYTVENGVLKIRYSKYKTYNSAKLNHLNKKLILEIPKELVGLEVDAVSSDVKVKNLTVKTLDISSVSGSLITENVISNSVDFETVSGTAELNGAFRTIDGEGVSGNTKIINTIFPDSVDIESVSGNIYMEIPENDGFRITKSSVSGTISSNFEGQIQNNGMVYKNGGSQFDFNTVSGSVTVNRLSNI